MISGSIEEMIRALWSIFFEDSEESCEKTKISNCTLICELMNFK